MNYIAYTIGPIYETILNSLTSDHKTKRLQAGSRYFSHFMKEVLKNIHNEFEVLVPYVNDDILNKEYNMGLFHDRFIAQSDKSIEEIKKIFASKLEESFLTMAKEIEGSHIAKDLYKNMDNHIIVASKEDLKKIDENIIFALNKILDAKELQKEFSFDIENNYIQQYQDNFANSHGVKTIENMSEKLGFKYYAVITADGDKMGDKIKNEATDNVEDIKELSKKLFKFFTDDEDIYTITNEKFGGELIYAGGDDILALLPVKYSEKTFLDYIEVLDQRFKEKVGNDVSLSFGVNIAYYKYPLRDAIENAFSLLHQAKDNAQNSLALKITKHSGQYFETVFELSSQKYELYKKLTDDILREETKLPHSLHHSLKRYEKVIVKVYEDERTVDAMFTTLFNDATQEHKKGLDEVKKFFNESKPKTEQEFNAIFSALSVIKFLREDRK